MGVVNLPRMFRPKPKEGDDVSAAFAECCKALNPLSPKSREMLTRWLHERYTAQLDEDMKEADGSLVQSIRDGIYRARMEQE